MLRKRDRDNEAAKIDLIPVLDAIFTMIFFLLFSAQFVKIYEMEGDAPMMSTVPQDVKLKKEPLNLIIDVSSDKIHLTTGVDHISFATYDRGSDENLEKMRMDLLGLRSKYPDDDYVIVTSEPQIKYDEIVHILDYAQKLPNNIKEYQIGLKTITKIFNQVVLVEEI